MNKKKHEDTPPFWIGSSPIREGTSHPFESSNNFTMASIRAATKVVFLREVLLVVVGLLLPSDDPQGILSRVTQSFGTIPRGVPVMASKNVAPSEFAGLVNHLWEPLNPATMSTDERMRPAPVSFQAKLISIILAELWTPGSRVEGTGCLSGWRLAGPVTVIIGDSNPKVACVLGVPAPSSARSGRPTVSRRKLEIQLSPQFVWDLGGRETRHGHGDFFLVITVQLLQYLTLRHWITVSGDNKVYDGPNPTILRALDDSIPHKTLHLFISRISGRKSLGRRATESLFPVYEVLLSSEQEEKAATLRKGNGNDDIATP
ncbi:hypothetical protein B0F90DRAFT_1667114 [Multifurca ochricompacta]|uniref:Uncharacterized protein n=1 Tax=Multifurca ochricompacta TaxID=376703 RepID=A0AAD4M7X9_9AGAM|nr:hypothetical protein B0F90DRAFT_1667114 [Multifurca ochricompacta]